MRNFKNRTQRIILERTELELNWNRTFVAGAYGFDIDNVVPRSPTICFTAFRIQTTHHAFVNSIS